MKLPKYGASRHWMDARGLKAGQPLPDAHPRHGTEPGRQLRSGWKERLLLHGRDGAEFLSSVWSAAPGCPGRHNCIRSSTITTDGFVGCAYQTAQRLGGVPPGRIAGSMSALVTTGSGGKRHRVVSCNLLVDSGTAGTGSRYALPRCPPTSTRRLERRDVGERRRDREG